jgi:DNA/RNA-binding domain of Phe-tRNA-synthetase-like protein
MDREVFLKWLEELDKAEKEQIETFNRYQREHPEITEWDQFFERLKADFKREIQKTV